MPSSASTTAALGLARLVCLDSSEAGDAVQAGSSRPGDNATVFVIAGTATMARPDRGARGHPPGPAASVAAGPILRRPAGDPIGTIDHRTAAPHASLALRLAFEGLPANQRAAIALHLHYGYSVAETARLVDAPVETVRSRIRAGREVLRHALEDEKR